MSQYTDEPREADAAEADVQEQRRVVAEEQEFTPVPRRDDVPEADWLEQSIAESLDEDER